MYSAEKLEDGKPTAALYSKDDLTINGSGILTVNGNYEDGIKANDIFRMTGGTLRVMAADDGINVNDYIAAAGAVIEVVSGGAMQAEQTGQSASGAVSSVLSFVREYTTSIVSLVLLAAAFVFVKLYKRRRY